MSLWGFGPLLPGGAQQQATGGTTTNVAGTLRHTTRVVVSRLSLLWRSAPLRATPRLRAAVLTSALALGSANVGEVRATARCTGQLGFQQNTAALAGQVRVTERVRGATLGGKVALAGRVRVTERLRGALGTESALAGRVRSSERLTGATLQQDVALAGRVRVVERVQGFATASVPGTTTNIAGTARATPARLRSISLTTAFRSSPVRETVRLRGALTVTGGGVTANVAGRVRVTERLTGQLTPNKATLQGGTIRVLERTRVSRLSFVRYAAPVREVVRLRGAVLSGVGTGPQAGNRGTLRWAPQRVTGDATLAYSCAEVMAHPRCRGAVLTLVGRAQLEGRLRTSQRLLPVTAGGKVFLRGTLRMYARADGADIISPFEAFLTGRVRMTLARCRAILTSSQRSLRGTIYASLSRLTGGAASVVNPATAPVRVTPLLVGRRLSLNAAHLRGTVIDLPRVVGGFPALPVSAPPRVGGGRRKSRQVELMEARYAVVEEAKPARRRRKKVVAEAPPPAVVEGTTPEAALPPPAPPTYVVTMPPKLDVGAITKRRKAAAVSTEDLADLDAAELDEIMRLIDLLLE